MTQRLDCLTFALRVGRCAVDDASPFNWQQRPQMQPCSCGRTCGASSKLGKSLMGLVDSFSRSDRPHSAGADCACAPIRRGMACHSM